MRTNYTADLDPSAVDGRIGVARVTVIHAPGHYGQLEVDRLAAAVFDTVLGPAASNVRAGKWLGDPVLVEISLAVKWEGDD